MMIPANQKPLNVLLLIVQFPPDVNSTGLLMAQIFEGLLELGHKVSVITSFPHYEHFRVWKEYSGKLVEHADHRGMDVLRVPIYANGAKERMANRLLSYLSFNLFATIATIFARHQYDVIFCTNGSFFTGIAAYIGGAIKRAPFIYNVQDLYPEVPAATGQLNNGLFVRILELIERFMYRKAQHITVISPSFRQNLLAKGVPPEKVSTIPNFVDTEFIAPLPRENDFSAKNGLCGKFVVSHAGNVGYVYDLDTMLDAAALLRDNPDILFLIVGDGVAKTALQSKAEALGLDNVRFLPFQPRDDLPWLRASSDVQVALYRKGSAWYSMPSKVYEIMASGRPLLASAERGSDVWQLVEDTGSGLCIEPEDPARLAEAILALRRDPELRDEMGSCGRQCAEQNYSRDAVVAQYDQLLRRLVPAERNHSRATA